MANGRALSNVDKKTMFYFNRFQSEVIEKLNYRWKVRLIDISP